MNVQIVSTPYREQISKTRLGGIFVLIGTLHAAILKSGTGNTFSYFKRKSKFQKIRSVMQC